MRLLLAVSANFPENSRFVNTKQIHNWKTQENH